MTAKIKIRCPQCTKQYSVPEGMDHKSVKCKQCGTQFKIGDARKQGPTPDPQITATVVSPPPSTNSGGSIWDDLDTGASAPTDSAFPTSPQPNPPQSPYDSAYGSSAYGSNAYEGSGAQSAAYGDGHTNPYGMGEPPAPTAPSNHVNSPMMVPAIAGAILFSLALAVISIIYSWWATFAPVRNRAPEVAKQNSQAVENAVTDFDPNQPSSSGPVDRPIPSETFDLPISSSATPDRDLATSSLEKAARERERRRQKELADAERARKDKEEAAKRAERDAEMAKRDAERRARQKAREEERARVEAAKLAKKKLIDNAVSPDDHLIYRIPIEGWGVNHIIATNDWVFLADHDVLRIHRWDDERQVQSRTIKSMGEISRLAINSSEDRLAVGGQSGRIEIYELDDDGKVKRKPMVLSDGHQQDITQLVFSHNGRYLASCDRKEVLTIWNTETGELIVQPAWDGRAIKSLFFPLDDSFVRVSDGNKLADLDLTEGRPIQEQKIDNSSTQAMTYLGNGELFALTRGSDVRAFESGQEAARYQMKGEGVQWSIAFSNSVTLYTGGLRMIFRWDVPGQKLSRVFALPEEASYIQTIALNPQGTKAAVTSGSARQDVFLIDLMN